MNEPTAAAGVEMNGEQKSHSGQQASSDLDLRAELERRVAFERLITGLSTHFIDLGTQLVDEGIHTALRAIGEFAGVDRAYIFRFSPDATTMSNTHEWCASGITPELPNLQGLPVEVFPWWCQQIKENKVIYVPDVSQLGSEAVAERDILQAQSIQSVVVVPLVYRKKADGFLGFDAVRSHKAWTDEDIALLKIVGEMFVNALERQHAEILRRSLENQVIAARSMENVAKLAGGVAHDFNNLLGIILNCAGVLSREVETARLKTYADDLTTAARQAASLTRQLLIIGRRNIVDPSVIAPNRVLRELETLIRHTLGENVVFELKLDESVRAVRLGRPQIEQIVFNLAMNARDAMPCGGSFSIETALVELDDEYAVKRIDVHPGWYVRLRVRDTGTGMTDEVQARAFEPFYTTRRPRGTGLGLSTVYSIVTEAQGHVVLESQLGHGTSLDVFFPAVEEETLTQPTVITRSTVARGRGETILVAEDCHAFRRLICEALAENGYHVLEAANADEAIALLLLRKVPIDLLLTDVVMPGRSGRQLADVARAQFGVPSVAYMSGYEDAKLAQHGVLEPGIRLLEKPFVADELLGFVHNVLDRAGEELARTVVEDTTAAPQERLSQEPV